MGAKIVAVSDSQGTIYEHKGLDYKKLLAIKKKTGSVINYPNVQKLNSEKIFTLPIDILIPAALPDVINEKNINQIKAKIIVEGANIPMSEETEKQLWQKNILVVPDIVANSGGVISSYCEYMGYQCEKMFDIVKKKITATAKNILGQAKRQKITPREAALKIAQARVKKAMKTRRSWLLVVFLVY